MAKKKNEKAEKKTPFVPVEEQPYQVLGNWCWVYGNDIFKPMETKKPVGHTFTYIDIDSIDNMNQCVRKPKVTETAKAPSRACRGLHAGDTLFSLVRPYLKNIAYIDESFKDCIASTGFYVCSPVEGLNSKYVYWLMTSGYVVEGLNKYMKGDNSPSIRSGNIESYPFPLAPLAEQQRIVDRIESLFTKLDEAKEKAQEALESFELRKSSMLHRAFTGELTRGWRKEHGVEKAWESTFLANVVSGFKYGTSEKSNYTNYGMPVFRIPNITDDGISFDDMKFLSHENVIEENQVHENDILIIRSNGSRNLVGKSALVPMLNRPYAYGSFLIRIKPMECVLPVFLVEFLNSSDARDQMFKKAKSSAGINNINSKELGAIKIDMPSIPEQAEIVDILDDFFAKEAEAKAKVEATLEAIDTIKKSILAKAFRGKLGTNNPEDESAEELIKRTLV
ncbi:MAG: restriction endonuclease subunit S [Clostridiaceae bacterium]|nr:restriction endonuclease subunit S [Clostridiaceae bacterium]